jgi:hypothetical protein
VSGDLLLETIAAGADDARVKVEAAKAFAALAAIGLTLAALYMVLLATYHADNPRPWSAFTYCLFVTSFASAFFAWRAVRFIGSDRPRDARKALVLQAPMAALLLLGAVQVSSHGDGKLLGSAVAVEFCAVAAFALSGPDSQSV